MRKTAKGMVVPDERQQVFAGVMKEMKEKDELHHPGIYIRDDGDAAGKDTPVDCEARRHICKSVCCKLNFHLSRDEIGDGRIEWDQGVPYYIRKQQNRFCAHFANEERCCGIYEHRPAICRRYTCANDSRIWKDFNNMELNHE